MGFSVDHLVVQDDLSVARNLFSESIQQIEMAISSYCNRVCDYCPNSFVDRRSTNNKMSDHLFVNIMRNLQEIQYSKLISLHRYNEPIFDFEYTISRVQLIRHFLPNATIQIFTNGDYLTQEKLMQLIEAGAGHVVVTIHFPPKVTDFNAVKTRLRDKLAQLDMPYQMKDDSDSHCSASVEASIPVEVRAINFHYRNDGGDLANTSNRGGSLEMKQADFVRTEPCALPFRSLQIEWDGTIMPCCNLHADVEDHKSSILAKLTPQSNLFLTWCNATFVKMRRQMISYDEKQDGCRHCDVFGSFVDSPEARDAAKMLLEQAEAHDKQVRDAALPIHHTSAAKSGRRNLVILRAGDSSIHRQWLELSPDCQRNFDVLVSYFGDNDFPLTFEEMLVRQKSYKFDAIHTLFKHRPELWDYDNFWLPDDDILISADNINRMFQTFDQYGLWLAQPSLTPDSYSSHPITVHNQDYALRFTTFAEVMAPVFAKSALQSVIGSFEGAQSAWGLDFVWPKILGYPPNKIAIFDDISMKHTREVGGGSIYKNINPGLELKNNMDRYGLSSLDTHLLGGILRSPVCCGSIRLSGG